MVALGAGREDTFHRLMESVKQFVDKGYRTGHNRLVCEKIGLPLCEAFHAFKQHDVRI
jgi:hypothetical protein